MSFPRYESYKDSGVEWLGNVPEHWNVARLGYECDTVVPMRDKPEDLTGEIPWIRIEDFNGKYISSSKSGQGVSEATVSAINLKVFPAGSVLCSCSCSMGATAIVTRPLVTNQTFIGIVPKSGYLSDFLFYLFLAATDHLNSIGTGAIQSYLSRDDFRRLRIPQPKYSEQLSIAAFLDRESAKIDALIAEQQRLIELLKEKRQAVISHAVTKGLALSSPCGRGAGGEGVPMKDSGIEWLGDVPAHWGVRPIKFVISKIESGTSVNATDEPARVNEIGVLKTSCVYSGIFDPSENKTVIEQEIDRVSCPVKPNTLIVSRMNTPELVGATGLVTDAPENIYLPDRLWQISFSDAFPAFVYYWTQTPVYRAYIKSVCSGTSSSMQNLSQDQFRSFILALPTFEEQKLIADFLQDVTTTLDTLTAEAQRGIDLLKERRTALISAAVTGKIDVRRCQPHSD